MNQGVQDVFGRLVDDANQLTLKVMRLHSDAIIPTKGSDEAAGFDLYATEDMEIGNQQSVQVHLGIAIEIPKGYVGLLFARSGIASKKHLRPSNCVGVIDSDYRGEVMVNLYNDSYHNMQGHQTISKGDRIAQLVLVPYISPKLKEVNELSDTKRGTDGFGSTDIKKV